MVLSPLCFGVSYHNSRWVCGNWLVKWSPGRAGGAAAVWCFCVGPYVWRVLKGSYLPPYAAPLHTPEAQAGSSGARQVLGWLIRHPGPGQVFAETGPRPCPYCVCSTIMRGEH